MKFQAYLSKSITTGAIALFAIILLCASAVIAQSGPGVLRGQVADPSGAAITSASVVLTPSTSSAAPLTTQTNGQGQYEFKNLLTGKYTLNVVAQGFSVYENDSVEITGDQPLRLNVAMEIQVEQQKVQVSDTTPTIDVNPASNAGAIVLSGKELEALPDDPDELLTDLQALAGPAAGPNGGQLYIDGFTAGQLPPKSSIREIRINQNPFSAEYDKLGYGRIEVFTKPGTDQFHGQFLVDGNDSAFNTQNPFLGPAPGYESVMYNGSLSGPINKKASFFFNVEHRNINDFAAINAFSPIDPTQPFVQAVPNPRQRTNIGPRIDFAPSKNNTLTLRYQYYRDTDTNQGLTAFTLPTQAYHSSDIEHTLQVSDTQILGPKVINETRFQYLREASSQSPLDVNPSVSVLGAFTGGGSGEGRQSDHQDSYEAQNYTSVIQGNHTIKFGARVRASHTTDYSTAGFNGAFTFSLPNYEQGLAPSQFLITACHVNSGFTTCNPNASVTYYDVEPYVQDDWKIRSNITLSYGLRFETQNHIRDHVDLAPRLGFAWGVGGKSAPPKIVIRGGMGVFYERFQEEQILQAERLNGITQQQYVIQSPTCFPGVDKPFNVSLLPSCGAVSSGNSSIYQISPSLYAPYTVQSAISVERQVTKSATLTLTYLNSRGFDQLLTINANAPFPGTPGSTQRPNPSEGNIYRYVSEGNFKQNQLIANTNIRVGSKLQLFGYYVLNYANSDASSVSSFPSNSYNISQDYGRASFDYRNRLFLGGSIALPLNFRLSPFMILSSGGPFNITVPTDLNGDSQFNDRPGFVSSATCASTTISGTGGNIFCTPLGTFDATPVANEKLVPINYATGPSRYDVNLRLTKTFGLGPRLKAGSQNQNGPRPSGGGGGGHGGGGFRGPLYGGGPGGGIMGLGGSSDRRYNLTLGVSARNAFNQVNLASPSGVLGSRFFDNSNSLQGGPFSNSAANRRIDLIATFSF
jgi:hypothetical protein